MPGGKHWVFTVFNYSDESLLHVFLLSEDSAVSYIVVGREIAPTTGTRHLQGFVSFASRKSFAAVRGLLPTSHIECARGSPTQCRTYCIKDGDYDEYGEVPPSTQGKRTDWETYRDWCSALSEIPTDRELMLEFPGLYGRYRGSMRCMADELAPPTTLRDGPLRPWQSDLKDKLEGPADDRTIEFVVDDAGGSGKSWFCGYMVSRVSGVQLLGPGKRDDLAYMIDVSKRIFLMNVPRLQMEFLNYGLLESLKDRMVLSPKYDSRMKLLHETPHVVVFCNEMPDRAKMTADRFSLNELS